MPDHATDPATDSAASHDAERRLTELESRIAHHERMAEEMSTVLFEQGRTIDLMTAQLRRLRDRVAELEGGLPRVPQDEPPPPHY